MNRAMSMGKLAEVVDGAWRAVFNRSTDADRKAIAGLREWLSSQPNCHAALLSTSARPGSTDEASARELEALLLGRVAKNELTRTTAAQHLYVLHRVGKRLRNQGVQLAPTWVSALLRPPPSPFPPETMTAVAKVEAWRGALTDIISKQLPSDGPRLWAITALSAVCHGALLDRGKLSRLRLELERESLEIKRATSEGLAFIDFLMPYQGLGNHHLQRWWPDAATELLLTRFPAEGKPCDFKHTISVMQDMLGSAGVPASLLPTKLTDLFKSASIWWALRCAPVDIHVMRRTFASHSLTARCWSRLVGIPNPREPGAVKNPGRGPTSPPNDEMSAEDELWLAATAEHEWLGEVRGALRTQDLTGARCWADALMRAIPAGDYRRTYIGWLCAALAVPPKNEKIGVGLEALAAPFLLAAPRLLCHFGTKNPAELELVSLDETYRVILDACEPEDPVERIARGLRLFHTHLISAYGAKPLADPRNTFGEGGGLMPVDATLIAVDEYLAAHAWLERELQYGADPVETLICRLVLTLTFRVGLRRGEVFGLRVCDIQDRGGLYLHVRRYPVHRLKTPNATRTVRIDALLTMRERALVRNWIATRKLGHDNLEEHELGQLRLLARPDAIEGPASVDGTVRRVMQAVHAVTKDARLVLHHLRHSAATWLWLKLRAPDYPELRSYISSMPALCAELRWSRRLRIQLCGATDGPSRAYSNVVAKVLGHGVPLTSLEHYIHTADLFLAATTARTVKSLPVMVWQGLTDASRSTVYQWLKRGPHGVVTGYRARQVLSNCGQSTPVRDDESHVNPWRKRAAALAVRFRSDGDIGLVSRALQLYNRLDDDIPAMRRIAEVAQSCSMNVATIKHWLEQARVFAPAFGIEAPDGKSGRAFQAVPAPEVNLHRATATALDDLSAKLAKASLKHPSLVGEALLIAASRFNLRRYDVCFRGEHDEIEARRFLKCQRRSKSDPLCRHVAEVNLTHLGQIRAAGAGCSVG